MPVPTKFSVSDASLFKLCPRRMFYSKVEGYEETAPPNHLFLGMKYDKLLEVMDKEGMSVAFEKITEIFDDEHEAAEAQVILGHYAETFGDQIIPPVGFNGNQHGFGIDLGDVRVTGYLDKLAFVPVNGVDQHVVVERKTTSESIEENSTYWKKLDLDPQIRSYVWYLRQKGLTAGWVCYEVIRKLGSSYHPKLANKQNIPIDQYRSLLASLDYKKTLVARKWFYVDTDMTQEFENEHQTVFAQFKTAWEATKAAYDAEYGPEEAKTVWPKHEQSCDSYGGCPFVGVCQNKVQLPNSQFVKKEGRFSCST